MAGWNIPHVRMGNTSSIRVHFPASYVSLPEGTWMSMEVSDRGIAPI